MSEEFEEQLSKISDQQKKDICIMVDTISMSIFGKHFTSCSSQLQQKMTLAVVNIIKNLKESYKGN